MGVEVGGTGGEVVETDLELGCVAWCVDHLVLVQSEGSVNCVLHAVAARSVEVGSGAVNQTIGQVLKVRGNHLLFFRSGFTLLLLSEAFLVALNESLSGGLDFLVNKSGVGVHV